MELEIIQHALQQLDAVLEHLGIYEHQRKRRAVAPAIFGSTKGLTTGLPITHYWELLFSVNELLPKARKLTDPEIALMVEKEFPKRRTSKHITRQYLKHKRDKYNCGQLTGKKRPHPTARSHEYNEKGQAIKSRSRKPLAEQPNPRKVILPQLLPQLSPGE